MEARIAQTPMPNESTDDSCSEHFLSLQEKESWDEICQTFASDISSLLESEVSPINGHEQQEISDFSKFRCTVENVVQQLVEKFLGIELDLHSLYHASKLLKEKETMEMFLQRNDNCFNHVIDKIKSSGKNYHLAKKTAQTVLDLTSSSVMENLANLSNNLEKDDHRKKLKAMKPCNDSELLKKDNFSKNPVSTTSFSLFDLMDSENLPSLQSIGIQELVEIFLANSSSTTASEQMISSIVESCSTVKLNELISRCNEVSDVYGLLMHSSENYWDQFVTILKSILLSNKIEKNCIISIAKIHSKWFGLFHQQGNEGEYSIQQLHLMKNILSASHQHSKLFSNLVTNKSDQAEKTNLSIQDEIEVVQALIDIFHTDMILSDFLNTYPGSLPQEEIADLFSMCVRLFQVDLESTHSQNTDSSASFSTIILAVIDPFSEWFSRVLQSTSVLMATQIIEENPSLLRNVLLNLQKLQSGSFIDEMVDTVNMIFYNRDDDFTTQGIIIQSASILHILLLHFGSRYTFFSTPLKFNSFFENNATVKPNIITENDLRLLSNEDKESKAIYKANNFISGVNHCLQNVYCLINPFIEILRESINLDKESLGSVKNSKYDLGLINICGECAETILLEYIESWEIFEPIFCHFVMRVINPIETKLKDSWSTKVFFSVCNSVLSRISPEVTSHQFCDNVGSEFNDNLCRFESSVFMILSSLEEVLKLTVIEYCEDSALPFDLKYESLKVFPSLFKFCLTRERRKNKSFLDKFTNILIITSRKPGYWPLVFPSLLSTINGLNVLESLNLVRKITHNLFMSLREELSSGEPNQLYFISRLIGHICFTESGCLAVLRNDYFPLLRINFFRICSSSGSGILPEILTSTYFIFQSLSLSPWFAVAIKLEETEALSLVNQLVRQFSESVVTSGFSLPWKLLQSLLCNLNNFSLLKKMEQEPRFLPFPNDSSNSATKEFLQQYQAAHTNCEETEEHIPRGFCREFFETCRNSSTKTDSRKITLLEVCNELSSKQITNAMNINIILAFYLSEISDKRYYQESLDESEIKFKDVDLDIEVGMIKDIFNQNHIFLLDEMKDANLENYISSCAIRHFRNGYDQIDWHAVCVLALFQGDFKKATTATRAFRLRPEYIGLNGTADDTNVISHSKFVGLVFDIIEIECPEMLSALELCGIPLASILAQWFNQSFVGIINFGQVILLNCTLLEEGLDFAIYYAVALLRHMQEEIFQFACTFNERNFDAVSCTDELISSPYLKTFQVAQEYKYARSLKDKYQKWIF